MKDNFDGYKKCPYCGKLILNNAVVCKHCYKTLVTDSTQNTKKYNIVQNFKDDSLSYKYGKICIAIVAIALIYSFLGDISFQLSHLFPQVSSTTKEAVSLPGYANQKNLNPPKQISINSGKKYRLIIEQAEYSLQGIVVAKNTNFWLRGIMYTTFDDVVPLDLGIVWGKYANKNYLKKHCKFKSEKTASARWLVTKCDNTVTDWGYIVNHLSHNHIIPANDNITSALLRLKKWDIVKLDGYLVDIVNPNGYTSYTSLSRTDHGFNTGTRHDEAGVGGACEIFYVTGVQIGNKYYK